jgi:signal transduction histidine kinase
MLISVSEELKVSVRNVALTVLRAPFTKRTWSELLYFTASSILALAAFALVGIGLAAGAVLAVTVIGLAVVGLGLRMARKTGAYERSLVRSLLGEVIEEPDPFAPRPGYFGWLQSAVRDRTAWRAVAYILAKLALSIAGVYVALSLWYDAVAFLLFPFMSQSQPHPFGLTVQVFGPGYFSIGQPAWLNAAAIFFTGLILLFAAPWAVRGVVSVDRMLAGSLLGPDSASTRVRSLEQARAQTVDASAATLRRIERDLHDGTQAQLVALAMRLGMAKDKLASADGDVDLAQIRALVDDAHRGAKEAITELRDLARGIHPPALDLGLEGALSTLVARSTVPTELTVTLTSRPTPSIEAIAYFCVAELLSNVAQHASASRASVSCVQHGSFVRLVVRDDGVGSAQLSRVGSSSSGLAGLADRVRSVDGRIDIVSPSGGPTVVTVDLPLHA